MVDVERNNGVHSGQKKTVPGKSTAQQYEEWHKITYEYCDSDKVEDCDKRGRVKVYEVH